MIDKLTLTAPEGRNRGRTYRGTFVNFQRLDHHDACLMHETYRLPTKRDKMDSGQASKTLEERAGCPSLMGVIKAELL